MSAAIQAKYDDVVKSFYDGIWTHGSVKERKDATHFDAISYINDLDRIIPMEPNTKSKMELYQDADGIPTTENYSLANLISGEKERWYWGWKRRDNASDYKEIKHDAIQNFIWNDIIEFTGYRGGYSEQKKLLFHSHRFNNTYKMMLKPFAPHGKDMVKGVLIGRFTFLKTGGYLGLKKVY